MAYLVDTSILVRIANKADTQCDIATQAVVTLHRRGEILHITPQVLIEFRNVATRPAAQNGLGLTSVDASKQATSFEATFPVMPGHSRYLSSVETARREFRHHGQTSS